MGRRCIACGFEPVRASLVEHEHGKSVEIDPLSRKKVASGIKGYAKSEAELFAAIATVEKTKAARRVENGRAAGNGKGATAHKYKEIAGRWPPREFVYETAPHTEPTLSLRSKLRSMDIAFAKSFKGR